jgi:hypothetical protein
MKSKKKKCCKETPGHGTNIASKSAITPAKCKESAIKKPTHEWHKRKWTIFDEFTRCLSAYNDGVDEEELLQHQPRHSDSPNDFPQLMQLVMHDRRRLHKMNCQPGIGARANDSS